MAVISYRSSRAARSDSNLAATVCLAGMSRQIELLTLCNSISVIVYGSPSCKIQLPVPGGPIPPLGQIMTTILPCAQGPGPASVLERPLENSHQELMAPSMPI